MSLILDALKRAERERHAGPTPAFDNLPAPRGPRRRWYRWLALSLLALVAVAVAVSVTRRPRPVAAPATTAAPQQEAAPVAPPTQAARPPVRTRPVPEVIPGTEGVASLDELTPESDLELVPAAPTAAAPASTEPPAAAPAQPQPVPAVDEEPVAAAPPALTGAAQSQTPSAGEDSRAAIPPALTQKAPVRKLREMPPDYRADFPALTVEVHVFEPGRRFVMVNGRRYREGERLAEGPHIVEIVRDGIVFDYRGEKVLFPLGR